MGTLRLLEAVKICGLLEKVKFYQASTSELYGKVKEIPQSETTPFHPRSPYGCAKLYGYWIVVNYREAYNMYACNGILFNHESPRRGEVRILFGRSQIFITVSSCFEVTRDILIKNTVKSSNLHEKQIISPKFPSLANVYHCGT